MQILHNSDAAPPPEAELSLLTTLANAVGAQYPFCGAVQLILTDDMHMRELNRTYRNRDYATDVLSFDLGPEMASGSPVDSGIGEIYISLDRASHQAAEFGVPLNAELARLLVHGLLHLAGYDHHTEAELRFMESTTDTFIESVGLLETRAR